MSRERKIDVARSDYNVVDREFGSMRDRFEAEMRRVEEEMSRLRREFETYTPKMGSGHGQAGALPYRASSPAGRPPEYDSRMQVEPFLGTPPAQMRRYDPYFDNIKSPLIRDESDGKTLRLRFDVGQYRPEEVTVKTVDNRLLVHAKHEERAPQRTVFREYNQEFMLPRGTNPERITSTLSTDGVLTVEAPLPALDGSPTVHRHQIAYK